MRPVLVVAAILMAVLAPPAGAAERTAGTGDGGPPALAVNVLAFTDGNADQAFVVLKGDRAALRNLLGARSIRVLALAQPALERQLALGRGFPVAEGTAMRALAPRRAALARAYRRGDAALAFVSTGPGPAVALVQGRTGAVAGLAQAAGNAVAAYGAVDRAGGECAYDERLGLAESETHVSALSVWESPDGCSTTTGVTVPLTDPIELGWATVARIGRALDVATLCSARGCVGSAYDGVFRATRALARDLRTLDERCASGTAECSDVELAATVRDRIVALERRSERLLADCGPAECPASGTVASRSASTIVCGEIWKILGVPCPFDGSLEEEVERILAGANPCDSGVKYCAGDILEAVEGACNALVRDCGATLVAGVRDYVLGIVGQIGSCKTSGCYEDLVRSWCEGLLEHSDPQFICPIEGRPASDAAALVLQAVGPDLMMQYIAGALQGDTGTPEEADLAVDVDENELASKGEDLRTGRKKRAAGTFRSYYEDPPKLDVTVAQPGIDWHYNGTCIQAPVYWSANYEWRYGSGWTRQEYDTMRDYNCGIAYTSLYAKYENYPFCAPWLPTYNIYNRAMVSGKPDGTLAGQSRPKKAGDCASWLRYERRLERTYPRYRCWYDDCPGSQLLASASQVRTTGAARR